MSKTIRIVKNGEKRTVHPEDLPWVILQLEKGIKQIKISYNDYEAVIH